MTVNGGELIGLTAVDLTWTPPIHCLSPMITHNYNGNLITYMFTDSPLIGRGMLRPNRHQFFVNIINTFW